MTDDASPSKDVPGRVDSARTELWYAWLEIAVEHERDALKGREIAERAGRRKGNAARGLELETKASMTTVVAAAAALETIANNLEQFLDAQVRGSAARKAVGSINAVFPHAIDEELNSDIRWLFALRNETIHYRSDWYEIEPHPVLGFLTTRVARTYSFEAARRSVDILLAALRAATKPGRSANGDAEFWALHWRSLPAEMGVIRGKR